MKAEAALRVASPLVSAPVADRTTWTLAWLAAEIVAWVGVRLILRQQQAGASEIVLLFADESEALTHPSPARVGRRGAGNRAC